MRASTLPFVPLGESSTPPWRFLLPSFIAVLCLVTHARAQDGLSTSAKQGKSLEGLVVSVSNALELHIPSVQASKVTRLVRKALANQRAGVVAKNVQALIENLVVEDMDLGRKDKERVQRDVCATLGLRVPKLARELVPLEPDANSKGDSKYCIADLDTEHAACLRHSKSVRAAIAKRNGEPLDTAIKKGMQELGRYYEGVFTNAFGIERAPKGFDDLLTGALSTRDTRRARLATVAKLRFLLRPGIYEETKAKTLDMKIDAEVIVEERIREVLTGSDLWKQLRVDHAAMVKDPKDMRREIKQRG